MPAKPGTKPIKPLKKGMGLYQVFYRPGQGPAGKPWCVVNLQTRDVNGRWHATREEALAQARALYARLGAKAKVASENGTHNAYFCFADAVTIPDAGLTYLEAIEAKTYHTPAYGPVEITDQKIQNFISNFKNGVRGQEIAINYDHGVDVAKGNKAAGWIRDAVMKDNKLMLGIEFTEPAKSELRNKEWKYFSLEWDDEWQNNDGSDIEDVVIGGALTNRPIAKGLMPINFSEIFVEQADYGFAVWSTAFVNNLPDSCFAYIAPGGKKDSEGKTVPRSLRFFPYKDASGKPDLPHVRNMVARAPQANVPAAVKARVQALGRRLLGKSMSEMLLEIEDETKEWEHSQPGTGSPPAPRTDEDGSDDPAIGGGWRRNTPPVADPNSPSYDPDSIPDNSMKNGGGFSGSQNGKQEGGTAVPFELSDNVAHELLRVLELPVDANGNQVLDATKKKFGEITDLRNAVDARDQEKQFAEKYPQFWNEHNALMERDRAHTARQFAESVHKVYKSEGLGLRETRMGMSSAAREKVEEVHRKFGEGTVTIEDYESAIKAIMSGGLLEFGEIGSGSDDSVPDIDTNSATGVAGARKYFAEVVAKIQRETPDMDYMQAVEEAAKKHPDLAAAYRVTLPA